jgi:alanyl-tRNA synthetase
VLGDQVQQKGSNINSERLRFDFSYTRALNKEELVTVEQLVNQWLQEDLQVSHEILSKEEALKSGAIAFFIERYPDQVSVYTIGDPDHWISKELCGGLTSQVLVKLLALAYLEIFKEKAVSQGVRRIYMRFRAE